MPEERFAIYYAPAEDSLLAQAARAWFSHEGWLEHTVSPRHYGFHATLKPPFVLAEGMSRERLLESVAAFAAGEAALALPRFQVSLLGNFLALTLSEPSQELNELAGRIVMHLDAYRRPAPEAELAQRRQAQLNERQLELLERWGYPYVLDQWQFHMTLSSSLPQGELRQDLQERLQEHFAPALGERLWLEDLCVFWQPERTAAFQLLERYPCWRR